MKDGIVTGLMLALIGWAGLILADDSRQSVPAQQAVATTTASLATTNKPQAAQPYTVIGYIEKRDRVITIKTGPRGPVYSVATKDGKTLHENLSLEQLKAQAPEIHEFIRNSVAGDAKAGHKAADARLTISAMH